MKYQARQRGYTVLGTFQPDQVLPYTGADAPEREFPQGSRTHAVKMVSLRYQTFKKNLQCVCCGIQGVMFLLEMPSNGGRLCRPHFNLYAEREGQLVQMTKDHICPRSRGGTDHISNMQTMCCTCNELKRDYATRLKTLRRIQDGVQTIYTISPLLGGPTLPNFATSQRGLAAIVTKDVIEAFGWEEGTFKVRVSIRNLAITVIHNDRSYCFTINPVKRI